MIRLEEKTDLGFELIIQPSSRIYGLSIGISREGGGSACDVSNYDVEKALRIFGKAEAIKMPDISLMPKIITYIEFLLKEGFNGNNSSMGTNLIFRSDKSEGLYFAVIGIQNDDWINYVKDHPAEDPFSREILSGRSSNNFEKAYIDLGEQIEDLTQ